VKRAGTAARQRRPSQREDSLKITVDPDRCVGSAYCQRIAPALFDLGDDGFAVVLDAEVTDEGAAAAREAETACPAMAIALLDA
jgi:ferredoxin